MNWHKDQETELEGIFFAPEEEEEKVKHIVSESMAVPRSLEEHFSEWKILIVDDEEDVHVVTQMLFEGVSYQNKPVNLYDAYSGKQAKEILSQEPDIALVFLDVVMETSHAGLEVVKYLREELKNLSTRIILRTGQPGEAPESSVIMQYEIDDYKLKTELTAQKMITSLIGSLRGYGTLRNLEFENLRRRKAEEELQKAYERLDKVFEQTVVSLSDTIELRDAYTAGHARNVGRLAARIAKEMGFDDQRCRWLKLAGYLHDIGKVKISMKILNKTGELSSEDWQQIRAHPDTGFEILKSIDFPAPLARIVHEHHERYDGGGYPLGKKTEELLLDSEILGVADVVEAMMLSRPYREALGRKKALNEIRINRGKHYHPQVVDICIKLIEEGFRFD